MIYRECGSKNQIAMEGFQAIFIITLLTWAEVSVFGSSSELSTTTGNTVNIPCVFEEGTLRNIYWYYNDGTGPQKILFFSKGVIAIDPEYADRANLKNDSSTLILKKIVVADNGTYRCDVDRQGQTPVPNIITELSVFSLRSDTLPVIYPCSGTDESSSCSIPANQSFTLTCTLPNVYPVQDTELIWYQEGKRVPSTHDDTHNDDGTTDISRQIPVTETGNFTCNATYVSANGTENTAVSVEAWIIPPTDVPNTPGKNLTSGEITGITIGIVLLVGISLAIITFFIYYRSKKQEASNQLGTSAEKGSKDEKVDGGNRTSQKINDNSQQDQVTEDSKLPGTSAEEVSKDEKVTEASKLLGSSSGKRSKDEKVDGDNRTSQKFNDDSQQDPVSETSKLLGSSAEEGPKDEKVDGDDQTSEKINDGSQQDPAEDSDALTPHQNDGDSQQDQDVATSSISSPKKINSTSPAATAPATTKTATTTDTTTTPSTAAPTSASNSPQIASAKPSTPSERPTEKRSKNEEASAEFLAERAAENGSQDEAGKTSPTQQSDFDDVLEALAKKIPDDTINKLGKKLGFNAVEINKYVATNSRYENVTCIGTLKMLRDWDIKQTKAKEGAALKKALNDAGLVRLAEEF